jgi:hypothetical protein
MARIFPTKIQGDALDSEKVFTGIDWDSFGSRLAQVREAEGKGMSEEVKQYLESLKNDETNFEDAEGKGMSEEVKQYLESLKNDETNFEDKEATAEAETEVVTAKKSLPDALKKHQFKSKEDEVDEEEMDEDKKIVRGKEASAQPRRKIVFSSAQQLSAEAIEAAKAAGDTELVNTILAARNERRQALAAQIEEGAREQMERSAKIAKRHAYRMSIVNSVEEAEKKIAEATSKANEVRTASGFVKISDLKGASREAFIKKCASAGFPSEYVAAMLGEAETAAQALSAEGEKIKNVMASSLDKEIKQAAVEGLVKTATLSDADYDRLRNYWKNELGYGAEEWIDDLFSSKYDK